MKYLFVHGGPGLNSNSESNFLGPEFDKADKKIDFWHEPSLIRDKTLKTDLSYDLWLNSLSKFIHKHSEEGPITVIAHSFGAFALNDLLPVVGSRISRLVLVAPVFNLRTLDQNIANLALKILSDQGKTEALAYYRNLQSFMPLEFDAQRYKILLGAFEISEVLPRYWHNQERAEGYNQFLIEDQWQVNFASFRSVRETIGKNEITNHFNGPVSIIYGRHDPVVKMEQDLTSIKKMYLNPEIIIMEHSGHYPHIEETVTFVDKI
jgi:pimeloyl-ACP methyl ester carboxylesterase